MRTWSSVLAVVWLANCASFGTFASSEQVEVVYGADAEENLKRGREALESKNFVEAERYFEYVKTKYAFIEAAKEAELLLADLDLERERFAEARDRYNSFIRLHPTHPRVDYAAFRAALSHFRDIPSDFFLLPPSAEKEQVELRAANTAMTDFVRNWPQSSHLGEAKKVLEEVKRRLADHELYAAEFYARRERWVAVVGRYKTVLKNYPGIGYDERASVGLYDAYRKLNDHERAREALESYRARFPESEGATRAKRLLELLPAPAPPSDKVGSPDAGA